LAPKLSIVTPSFNQGRFIERTIRSVLDQGYENLEYVIVDGGSTDESVEVIERYADRLAWWVSEPDGGQAEAINKGIERTSGEIVAYVNSDDYYFPGAFEKATAALARSGAAWAAGAADNVDVSGARLPMGVSEARPPEFWEDVPRGRQWWLLRPWSVPQPAAFWTRAALERNGLFRTDMHYAFDAELMIRLALAGEQLELIDEILAARVAHDAQKSADMSLWRPEVRKLTELHAGELTAAERRRLKAVRLLRGCGFYRFRDAVIHPLAKRAGSVLRQDQ
jgi:glycosyltransferase involved in cell wall biosynthesis